MFLVLQTIEEKNLLIIQQEERIKEMMAVMSLASRLEAEEASKKEETIGRLQTENQVINHSYFFIELIVTYINLHNFLYLQ